MIISFDTPSSLLILDMDQDQRAFSYRFYWQKLHFFCCHRVRLVWPRRPKKVQIEKRRSSLPKIENRISSGPIAEVIRVLRGHGTRTGRRRKRQHKSLFYTILYCDVLNCQPTAKWIKSGKSDGWVWQRFGRKCFCKIL